MISLQQRLKLLNFLDLHSPDSVFVAETWLYLDIEDSEVIPLNCNHSTIARQDRSGGEHGSVFNAAEKDFSFNYSGQTLKIGQINNFAVGISIVSIQNSHMYLLIYNPPSVSLYRLEANHLADLISSCHVKFGNNVPTSFFILGDLNFNNVSWATVTGHSVYSKRFLLKTQQNNPNLLVFEPTYKSGSTPDEIRTSDSELLNLYVDSHLFSDHYPLFGLLNFTISYSESATKKTNSYSSSSCFCTYFNSHLSKGFNTYGNTNMKFQ